MSTIVVATHGHCFDGLCSAVMFTRLFRHLRGGASHAEPLDFRYLAMGYGPGENGVDPALLTGDDNAILDYRYSASPKLTWYFDHHVSAFPLPDDRASYEAHLGQPRQFFHDGTYGSCTKLIADIGAREFGLDPAPMAELVHWADMIDAARFPNPQMPVQKQEPVLQLMAVVETEGDADFLTRMVPRLLEEPLVDLARSEPIARKFVPIAESERTFQTLVKSHAVTRGPVVLVDLGDVQLESAAKFVTYALYPESAYSVMLTRSAKKLKISIGYNPWSKITRTHDIASICERHGGGGHPVVGAISLRLDELVKAKELAGSITEELAR